MLGGLALLSDLDVDGRVGSMLPNAAAGDSKRKSFFGTGWSSVIVLIDGLSPGERQGETES